jgi:hypothetical protein
MPWTDLNNMALPAFIVDPQSVDLLSGRQVDWDTVAAGWNGVLPAGTVVVEQGDGTIVPRADGAGTVIGILASAAERDNRAAALTGYGVISGAIVYTELLPDADAPTWLDGVGKGFVFETYEDDRA